MSLPTTKEVEITNMLSAHSDYYLGKVRVETLRAYAKKLAHVDIELIKSGLDRLSEDAGRIFPSLAEVRLACGDIRNSEKEAFNLIDSAYESEERTLGKIKEVVNKNIKEEDFLKYFNYYLKEMFGPELPDLKQYGLTFELFKKCAYFDLYEAKFKIPEAIKLLHEGTRKTVEDSQQIDFRPKERKVYAWHQGA